jgi:hypothetical protein
MPSAFSVANSPLTANGTIAVTGAGVASQYIRGDGTLADFPSSGGGGSSVSYYLNGGTSQGTIGGTTYYEMSKTAVIGTGVDFAKSGDGFIVAFLTDANDPAQLNIPAGNWNYEIYASMSSNGGTPQMYAELYKYDGTTFTLISTSSNEIIYDGTALNLYTFAMAVPDTSLTLTDRLAVKLYATNSGGKTTTIHTQDGHLCQIITTFSTGITALNGLTAQVQYFQVGTSGTDFNISSTTATHTFNLPTASATNRGALSSADWTTFNNKQNALTNPITGTGTSGQVAYFNGTSSITSESNLFWDATNDRLGIRTNAPNSAFQIGSDIAGTAQTKLISVNDTTTTDYSNAAFFNSNIATTRVGFILSNSSSTNWVNNFLSILVAGASHAGNNYFTNISGKSYDAGYGMIIGQGSQTTGLLIGTQGSTPIYFGTSNNARLSIFSNGNVGINTTTDAGFKLDVNGTARVQSDMIVNSFTLGKGGGNVGSNTAFGLLSLSANTSGIGNTAIGNNTLQNNTTGTSNIAVGSDALNANTIGDSNVAIGRGVLQLNTSGNNNNAVGRNSLNANISGVENSAFGTSALSASTGSNNSAFGFAALASTTSGANEAFGSNALRLQTTGNFNAGFGNSAFRANTTGSRNTGIGFEAGRYIANKSTEATIVNNSIFVGWRTSPLANNQTNQIVIGYDATGLGSNTTVLGNSSTTLTALYGAVITGGTSVNASAQLQVDSTTKGFLPPRMTAAQRAAISSPAEGLIVVQTDGTQGLYLYIGAAWHSITML